MTERKIRVIVSGASGRMGRETVKMVLNEEDFELTGAAAPSAQGKDAGIIAGVHACGVIVDGDLSETLAKAEADVLVDFTKPELAVRHTRMAIEHGVRPVIGTTGFTPEDIQELDKLCREHAIGGLIAPNFSVGAILMMKFAQEAAKYFPHVEIIEYHGDQKLDAPSGTAMKTAELISETRREIRQGHPNERETLEGSRGGYYNGFRIHSVRLPGVFAQQEVIFGAFGQTLKIRHDSYERAGYMSGVSTAIRKVMELDRLIYGFEHIMD